MTIPVPGDLTPVIELLPWVLPPLLGAAIGYLTNSVAIRMLFRPLRPIRILGIRLPFTPGVIPRQRDDLAESIGAMVAEELLTTDVFESRFRSASFSVTIRREVYQSLRRAAAVPLGEALKRIDANTIVQIAADALSNAICKEDRSVDGISRGAAKIIASRSEEIARAVTAAIATTPVPATVDRDDVWRLVTAVWPATVETVDRVLADVETRRQMEALVRRVLAYTLDQLTGLQRLMVSAGGYDRQLVERTPSIVARISSELVVLMQRDETKERVGNALIRWTESNRHRSLGSLLPLDTWDLAAGVVQRALSDTTRTEEGIRAFLTGRTNPDYDAASPSGAHGTSPCHELVGALKGAVTGWFERQRDTPLGVLLPVLERRRGLLAREIASRGVPLLAAAAPRFVAHLDVRRVVVERINALDVEQVEGILLGIIKRHLRWINAFGALLGAIIGATQLLIRAVGL
ncbi:MAG: DUF445 family protein [Alkalispirochaeta sp.]